MKKDYVDWINEFNVGIINENSQGIYLKMMIYIFGIDNLYKFVVSNLSSNT